MNEVSRNGMSLIPVASGNKRLRTEVPESTNAGMYRNFKSGNGGAHGSVLLPFFKVKEIAVLFCVCKEWRAVSFGIVGISLTQQIAAQHKQTNEAFKYWNQKKTESEKKQLEELEKSSASEQEKKLKKDKVNDLVAKRVKRIERHNSLFENSGLKKYTTLMNFFQYSKVFFENSSEIGRAYLSIPIHEMVCLKLSPVAMESLLENSLVQNFTFFQDLNFSFCNFSEVGFNTLCKLLIKIQDRIEADDTDKWLRMGHSIIFQGNSIDRKPLTKSQVLIFMHALDYFFHSVKLELEHKPLKGLFLKKLGISNLDFILQFCEKYFVRELYLSFNPLNSECIVKIAHFMRNPDFKLEVLNLFCSKDNNPLIDKDYEELLAAANDMNANMIHNNKKFRLHLPVATTERQAEVIKKMNTFKWLRIEQCELPKT